MKKESFQGILLGIVIMCAVFAFITIAWAAFSTTLNISGTATIKKQSWQIDFTDQKDTDFAGRLTAVGGGATALPLTGTVATGTQAVADTSVNRFRISSANTVEGTIGEFNVGGDKITYTWYAQNFGTFESDVSVKTVGGLTSSANLAGGNITLVCTKTSNGDMNDWCNGKGTGDGTSNNDKAHVKATLSVGAVGSPNPYSTSYSTWNIKAATSTSNDDTDILEFKLEVEFLNLAGSGDNPTTSSDNIMVSIPATVLEAVQHTTGS